MFNSFFDKFKSGSPDKSPKDPVCGMAASSGASLDYKGRTYSFCSDHCREEFQKEPEKYTGQDGHDHGGCC